MRQRGRPASALADASGSGRVHSPVTGWGILETRPVGACAMNDRLLEAYRRERLSFMQYVRQATPYAGPADRPLLERVRELAAAEAAGLDGFAEYLDDARVPVPFLGAFPTAFTNYNFVAIRKLLP